MSTNENGAPERLRSKGATELERRLLEAASREQPLPELSERMARAIGVSIPIAENAATHGGGSARGTARPPAAPRFALPWTAGLIAAGAVVIAAVVAWPPRAVPPQASPSAAPATPSASAPELVTPPATPVDSTQTPLPASRVDDPRHSTAAPPLSRSHTATATSDLRDQLSMVGAAHRELSRGQPAGALALSLEYLSKYPNGSFRPEAAAIRIEALVKLGRVTEARALANQFASSYGSGPLADRVATLSGASPR